MQLYRDQSFVWRDSELHLKSHRELKRKRTFYKYGGKYIQIYISILFKSKNIIIWLKTSLGSECNKPSKIISIPQKQPTKRIVNGTLVVHRNHTRLVTIPIPDKHIQTALFQVFFQHEVSIALLFTGETIAFIIALNYPLTT